MMCADCTHAPERPGCPLLDGAGGGGQGRGEGLASSTGRLGWVLLGVPRVRVCEPPGLELDVGAKPTLRYIAQADRNP